MSEGLWWKPFSRSGGFVALLNTTPRALDAVVETLGAGGESLRLVNQFVGPNSTVVMQLRELVNDVPHHRFGGVRVSYQGEERSLSVIGGIEDIEKGYSAAIPFVRPMLPMPGMLEDKGASMGSAGMTVGHQDPMMGFSKNTVFRAYALVRNISGKTVTVSPSITYQLNGSVKSEALPVMQLRADETAPMIPKEILAREDLKDSVGSINLRLAYDAPPGSLIAATGSVAKRGRMSLKWSRKPCRQPKPSSFRTGTLLR